MNVFSRGAVRDVLERLYEIFFIQVSASKAALFRISLGIVALLNELMWSGYVIEIFGDQGLFSNQFIRSQIPPTQFSPLLNVTSDGIVWGLYCLLVAATLCFTLGIYTRVANFIMYFLLVSFHVRAPMVHNGPINLLCIGSFFSLFLRCDGDLALRPDRPRLSGASVEGWAIRILQVQVALVYLFTSIEKIRVSPQWFNGTYLFYALTWPAYSIYDMSWMRDFPVVVNGMTWFTLFAELMFFFWIWFKQTRVLALSTLALMHVGGILLMNVDYFGETIMAFYVVFFTDKECERICGWIRKKGARLRMLRGSFAGH
jgi:hypothetical protein